MFEVLIQLPISKLGRIPEVIYMDSKHLYDTIVVKCSIKQGKNPLGWLRVCGKLKLILGRIPEDICAVSTCMMQYSESLVLECSYL